MKPTDKQVAQWVDEACDRYMTQDAHFMYVAHAAYAAAIEDAIDRVAFNGGTVELEAHIRALKEQT